MTKFDMSNLFFTILIFSYPTSQLARLEEFLEQKINTKMISIRGRGCLRRKCLSIVLFDSSPPLKSEFSEQPAGPSRIKLSVLVIPTTIINIPKYFENNLQQFFKAVLEA